MNNNVNVYIYTHYIYDIYIYDIYIYIIHLPLQSASVSFADLLFAYCACLSEALWGQYPKVVTQVSTG